MASYNDPTLEERTALAKAARDKALAKLAAKPKIDDAVLAERIAAAAARDAAQAEKSAAKKAAIAQAKADKKAASMVPEVIPPTEEELKAARDAKYAARKKRKG